MALNNPIMIDTIDIEAGQGDFTAGMRIKLNADGNIEKCGATDICCGNVQFDVKEADNVAAEVLVNKQQYTKTAAALAIGDLVIPAAGGLIVKGTGAAEENTLGYVQGVYQSNVTVLRVF